MNKKWTKDLKTVLVHLQIEMENHFSFIFSPSFGYALLGLVFLGVSALLRHAFGQRAAALLGASMRLAPPGLA